MPDASDIARLLADVGTYRRQIDTPGSAQSLVDSAIFHGVHALLYSLADDESELKQSGAMRQAAFRQTALFQLQDRELERVCTALHGAEVPYLLVKGAALCYQLYPAPESRPRSDTDIFIDASWLGRVTEVLFELGYRGVIAHEGGLVSSQTGMVYNDRCELSHAIDIHWDLSNRHEFRRTLEFDRIYSSAVLSPRFSIPVRVPNEVYALCLACLHLVGHHSSDPRLIWLFDIELLLRRLCDDRRDEFVELVLALDLAGVAGRALTEVHRCFGSDVAPQLLARLGYERGVALKSESRFSLLRSDMRSLPGFSAKCRYLTALAFPPVSYIQSRFRPSSKAFIPWCYVRRIVNGGIKTAASALVSRERD